MDKIYVVINKRKIPWTKPAIWYFITIENLYQAII